MSTQGLDEQTKALQELRSMIVHILRTPPLPIPLPTTSSLLNKSTPAALGSLFVGISIALMLFGTVTFLVGLILMPLAFTMVLLFNFVAFVSGLSQVGRSILWPRIHNYSNNKISPAWTIEPELYPVEEQRSNRNRLGLLE